MTKALWTAIVLAGQRPGIDPLASHFGERWKALVHVAGEAMVTRVVRTLGDAATIGRILVLTQEPKSLNDALKGLPKVDVLPSGGGISTSILNTLDAEALDYPILVTTADHPLLTADMVRIFMDEAEGDVAVAMVERQIMMAAYPDNRRTWLRFRDGDWSGCNLFALRSDRARAALRLWAEAEKDRKKAWKLFLHFGPMLALRALTRTIGLQRALGLAGRRLGLEARLVAMPIAEAAIDVDKPSDHELAEAIFAARLNEAKTAAH